MNKYFKLLSLLIICGACSKTPQIVDIIEDNFEFADQQLRYAISQIDSTTVNFTKEEKEKQLVCPRSINTENKLIMIPSKDWCSGFFPGELWYMYEYTGDDYWRKAAEKYTAYIEREKLNGKTHDMGFKIYCSFGNGYRLTQNETYKNIMIKAAETLITRYNPNVGCIRSWNHHKHKWQFPVIVDNMMNLELLFWAYNQTKDKTFYDIAVSHARTTLKNHFRDDFSSYHVIDYDTITGKVLKRNTHQGFSDESAWARGQAWGLYGYTMCYRETHIPAFLEQAKKIANYIYTHKNLPSDKIPYWDFNAPNIPNEVRDVSSATIISSALYELSKYDTKKSEKYISWADSIINNLTNAYRANLAQSYGFLLLHSTGSAPHESEIDVPLVYADYYFLEALLRRQQLISMPKKLKPDNKENPSN